MKICIIGDGLTGLVVAKALINNGIYTDVFISENNQKKDKSRTLGISKTNIEFFNENILNIENLIWDIKKIEIYSENLDNEKVIDFEKDDQRLFSLVRNHELIKNLLLKCTKSKFFKLKKNVKNLELIKKKYKLIINCEKNNYITKKYFHKRFDKNYKSHAFTTIIDHARLSKNNIASQIFTKKGPVAFLPISEKETSLVCSLKGNKDINIKDIIKKYNIKYEIKKINKISCFELKSSNLRSYYNENILAFGDLLHKIHPLAGQGFNMTIRDVKVLLEIIKFKINLGLDLDNSIFIEFEKRTKHKNYIFSNGIDFIYEFFNFENKINSHFFSKYIKTVLNNKVSKNFFTKYADEGLKS